MKVGNSSTQGKGPRMTRFSESRFKCRPHRKWLLLSSLFGLLCLRLDTLVKLMINVLSPTA
jgi:hypothetical protein